MEPLIAAMMAFSRLSGLLLAMPGTASLPPIARLALGLPLTLVLYPAVENLHLPATVPLLIAGIALEVATGITMGMVVSMMVGALTLAGEMISVNVGLSMAQMLDPLTHSRNDILGSLCSMLALGLLMATDTHLHCIQVLGRSFHTFPPGSLLIPNHAVPILVRASATALESGIELAGPVVAFSFLTHLAISLLGRMAPNLNIFFGVGLSLNLSAGLVVFLIAMPAFLYAFLPLLDQAVRRAGEIAGVLF